jgi:hypothetical protein
MMVLLIKYMVAYM